jgi:hypothetical protein
MINESVFKNTVLLIIELAGENGIGGVKLNKTLIITDALNNAIYGESLTGASYIKHRYGPVPGRDAYTIIKNMIDHEEILVFEEMTSPGMIQKNHYLNPFVEISRDVFTEKQIEFITWTVSRVMAMTAQEISELSHNDFYFNIPMFHEIDLNSVCKWEIIDGEWTEEKTERAKKVVEDNFEEISSLIRAEETAAYSTV